MTDKGIKLIQRFEGCRLESYKCPAGVWTIGYGHTKGVKPNMKITQEEAENMLQEDISIYEKYVDEYVTSDINPYQHDALSSFCYNLGPASLKQSTLLKKVNANPNDPSIAKEFSKWVFAGGKKLEGLVKRRKAESELYFEKIDTNFHKCNLK